MNDALLALDAVTLRHPGAPEPVFERFSLSLHPEERLGVSGPNGAGKSTLLLALTGWLRPRAGTVWAFGRARTREEDFTEVRRRAGLVFEDPDDQLFCATVGEDVLFGPLNLGRTRTAAEQDARDALARMGLTGFEHRATHQLSHGEKRRAALAAVWAMRPEVLLLDEPDEGLDDEGRARLVDALRAWSGSFILVSHRPDLLDAVCTRQLRLDQRRGEIGSK
jgi:cobalt/nickel transport system ATP-binding protein